MSVLIENRSQGTYLITGVQKDKIENESLSLFGRKENTTSYRYVLRPGEHDNFLVKKGDILAIEVL